MGNWGGSSARRTLLLLHRDQHEIVLAACFPLNRSSTKTKTEEENNMLHSWTSALRWGVCVVTWWACPVSPQDAVHFGRAVGGRPRQTYRKDQPQRSTYTLSLIHTIHTHHFSLYIQPQWTAAPWCHRVSLLQKKRQKGVRSCAKPNYQAMQGRAGIFPQGWNSWQPWALSVFCCTLWAPD